ncbi:MAG TPA: NAD(P)-binding domain-containing protein [Burkholderiales bacterium]|nr:NAD(P)-binding domain-containing protein [Burkholderiales bacterium]
MKPDRRRFFHALLVMLALGPLGRRAARAANAGPKKARIGIVGSGNVGGTLGAVWVRAGHEVMFSSRDLAHDRELAAELGKGARAGTPREAAAFGEAVMISVPYGALPAVGKELGELLQGKVVIDTCNPFASRDGEIADWARRKGAGLASAELLPGARLVRAFNAIGAERMGEAHREPGRVAMPIASDDAAAVAVAAPLIREIGYEPVLIGDLAKGRYLMPGTVLAGEHTAEELRTIAKGLD